MSTKKLTQEEKNKKTKIKEAFRDRETFYDRYGRKVTKENAEVDHKVPKKKGGNSNLANLEVIARKSNREKSDKLSGTMSNGSKFKVNRSSKNKSQGNVSVKKKDE